MPIALKIMKDADKETIELMNIEIETMAKLKHKNVVNQIDHG